VATCSDLVRFFHDCLREERSRAGIADIFAGKIISRRVITGREAATEHEFASLDLPTSFSSALISRTRLQGRRVELLYGTLPITGLIKGKKTCAPLLLYPVSISNDQLIVELEGVRINPSIISLFDLTTKGVNELLKFLPGGIVQLSTPGLLAKELQLFFPNLDISGLAQFPHLLPSREVQKASRSSSIRILPASALILAERTANVTGLLDELQLLGELPESKFPAPLNNILGCPTGKTSKIDPNGRPQSIPTLLSSAQERLLQSINTYPLSVCQGPPGTGKSFSLAASAAEQILRGQSVIIGCRSNEAADVLHQKLKELLPHSQLIVRAGRKKHLKTLKANVDRILSLPPPQEIERLNHDLPDIIKSIFRSGETIRKEIDEAISTGDLFRSPPDSWWDQLRKWLHLKKLGRKPLLSEATLAFYQLHQARLKMAKAYNRDHHRADLQDALRQPETIAALKIYRKALRHRYHSDQEKALQKLDPAALFNIFPVWITTTDDLHRVLPFKPALFDLAIIDEATQCDLGAALPLLFRQATASSFFSF